MYRFENVLFIYIFVFEIYCVINFFSYLRKLYVLRFAQK